jgi:hypothetical protein
VENQLSTGWLSPYAWLRAWPSDSSATSAPTVRFTLSLPREGAREVHMQLGDQLFVVRSGSSVHLTCRSPKWPLDLVLASNDVAPDPLGRPVTVDLTQLTVTSGAARTTAGCSTTAG